MILALAMVFALISSLFLAIHKVFLQKSALIRTQIFSRSALADLIIVYRGRIQSGFVLFAKKQRLKIVKSSKNVT